MVTIGTSEKHDIRIWNTPFIIVVKLELISEWMIFEIIGGNSAQMYFHMRNINIALSKRVLTLKIIILLLDTTYRNVRHIHFFPLVVYTYHVQLRKTSTTKLIGLQNPILFSCSKRKKMIDHRDIFVTEIINRKIGIETTFNKEIKSCFEI